MVNRSYLVAAALLAACSIPDTTFVEIPDDGGAGSSTGSGTGAINRTVIAHWSFVHLATGAQGRCPHVSDVARVLWQPWNPTTQQLSGALSFADFDCTAGSGVIAVPGNGYRISVEIRSATGQTLGNSNIEFIDTSRRDGSLDAIVFDDAGYLAFSWDLIDNVTQARVSCASAGITASDAIEIVETSIANPSDLSADDFTCDDHFGTTVALLAGHYTLSINAVRGTVAVGQSVIFGDGQIVPGDVTDLGNVKIRVPVH